MKTLLSALVLFSSLSVSAEVIKVQFPKAGTFLVKLVSPSPCMPSEFTLVSKDIIIAENGVYSINVEVREMDVLYGRAQWCHGDLVANGVYIINNATELNISLPEYFKDPKLTVAEVVQTVPVE